MNRALLMLMMAAPLSAGAYPEMIPLEETSLVGRAAPEVDLKTLGGEAFVLSEAKNTPVVLAFWASWCGPCRNEMPALIELQKARSDVRIVMVNVDRDRRDAQRFLSQVGITPEDAEIALDSEALALGAYGVMSMPTTFLVDGSGVVKFHKVGYSTEKGLTELIEAIEGVKP
ncbi:MAG: cytochrome c biogenesis protein CcmG/thiol:disulfide interchange protein DsbE [Myxococcota bacterium]|jgi:cytochrome c biogenesis protein CcmG/thiol:disulfide interchange protein DsbE